MNKYKFRNPSSEYRNPRRYGQGWWEEPERHSLSARGIKSGRRTEEKIPFLMKTVLPHIPMIFGLSPGSKEFLNRRGKEQDVIDILKRRGWKIKYSDYPPPGAYEAYKGSNYMLLGVTHWDKLKIEKISLTDPNERRILHTIFRKPYPYTIPDYAKNIDDNRIKGMFSNYNVQNIDKKWTDRQFVVKVENQRKPIFKFDIYVVTFNQNGELGTIIKVRDITKRYSYSSHSGQPFTNTRYLTEKEIKKFNIDYAKSSTEQEINKILYEPKKSVSYRKVLTIEIPRNKSHNLDFLKAYTEFNTVGVWKNYKDKNIQVEIEFKDNKNDTNSKHLLDLMQKLNKDKIKEKVIYARVEPIEKSTLSYSLAQAKLFAGR